MGIHSMSNRQLRVIIVLVLANIFEGSTTSVFAPFYPAEAESKGMSATEYGIVFNVFQMIPFIFSPLFGKYLYKLGSTRILNIGLFFHAIGCILLGTLDSCEGRTWFIPLSFVFRIIQALGSSAYVTAAFSVIAIEFPLSMAKTFAVFETAFGIGSFIGPAIGGLLFEAGGFPLPFVVLGGSVLFMAIVSLIVTPAPTKKESSPEESGDSGLLLEKRPGMFELLRIPGIFLAATTAMCSGMTSSFMGTILEPHIRHFNLRPVQVTGFFIALTGTYAVSAPIWGWVTDRTSLSNFITLAGTFLTLTGCILVGPAPFVPFDTILWVTWVACLLQGLGMGALNVSSFLQIEYGFPDDVTTYGLTSGLWFSTLSLGYLTGPIAAGVLYDIVGFRMGSLFCVLEISILMLLQIIFICWIFKKQGFTGIFTGKSSRKAHNSEYQPLINHRPSIY